MRRFPYDLLPEQKQSSIHRYIAYAVIGALVIGTAFAWASKANAGGLQFNCNSSYGYGYHSTRCALEPIPEPRKLTAEEIAEQQRSDEHWLAYCQPKRQADDEGVIHLTYAHPGCEHGRSE